MSRIIVAPIPGGFIGQAKIDHLRQLGKNGTYRAVQIVAPFAVNDHHFIDAENAPHRKIGRDKLDEVISPEEFKKFSEKFRAELMEIE